VPKCGANFTYRLDRDKLREVRRRGGRYLLRTNLTESDPAKFWQFYLHLVEVETAFRTLKGDLAIRSVYHQEESRQLYTRASPGRGCRSRFSGEERTTAMGVRSSCGSRLAMLSMHGVVL
jgi:hypothetical protein